MTEARGLIRAAARRSRVARSVAVGVRAALASLDPAAQPAKPPKATPTGGPRRTGPLGDWASMLPDRAKLRVVLLASAENAERVASWLPQFPKAHVHVLSADAAEQWEGAGARFQHHRAATVSEIAERLRLLGPVDVLVDLRWRSLDELQEAWGELYFHVARFGLYVVDRAAAPEDVSWPDVADWLTEVASADATTDATAHSGKDEVLADATGGVAVTREVVIVRKRHHHFLKLRWTDVAETLTAREPGYRVTELERREGGTLRVPGQIVSHRADVEIPWLPREMPYPPIALRHYEGPVTFAGQMLFYTRTTILPDSFKWWLTPDPRNHRIRTLSPSFARIPPRYQHARTLRGTYYQLDPTFPAAYGHIMTETIGKLWGWDAAKRQFPDLKVLFFRKPEVEPEHTVQYRLFREYGIEHDDIVAVDEPVRVTSLVSATPMWHNADPHCVNPGLRQVWDRLSGIAATDVPTYDRIFVSRTNQWWHRPCRNVSDVEDVFRGQGFEIIYPETIDLSVQAAIFRDARVVAGFGGSAMFNVMYSRQLETMIVLSHEAYTARNEHLYSALLGCDTHYFWSPPDIPHPPGGWSQAAFDSGWEFDLERNRADLERVASSSGASSAGSPMSEVRAAG